jgi:hypothetical protein
MDNFWHLWHCFFGYPVVQIRLTKKLSREPNAHNF